MLEKKQLHLSLNPVEPYSKERFVVHSGVVKAFDEIGQAVSHYLDNTEEFHFFVVYGNRGVGKSHLLNSIYSSAIELGARDSHCLLYEFEQSDVCESQVSEFVASYELLKREGGILLVGSRVHPQEIINPHLGSRLLSARLYQLQLPQENEIEPLVVALLEKNNLKLSNFNLQYLLKRLPLAPLSFDSIFAKISDLSLSQGKPAKLGVIKAVVEETNI